MARRFTTRRLSSWALRIAAAAFGIGLSGCGLPSCGTGDKPAPSGAVTEQTAAVTPPASSAPLHDARWEEGPAALERALSAHRATLLYVSSSWCPPCRALEANTMARQAFWDATKDLVHVRIDGDSEGAQAVAERFEARAYPTLLLLDSQGQEAFRAHHEVSVEELSPALASVAAGGQGFSAALGRLETGSLAGGDCGLFAAVDFSPASGMSLSTDARIQALLKAFSRCDGASPAVRARLAADLLGLAATADNMADSALPGAPVRPLSGALVDTVFQSEETAWAARTLVTTWATPVVTWLVGDDRGPAFAALRDRWLRAARAIRTREGAGLDMQLLAYNAALDLHKLEHGSAPVPASTQGEIEAAVSRMDALAKTQSERHSVVSNEAYLLRSIGFEERAKQLLIREISHTDAASHYQTMLSLWAKEAGRRDEARQFARDAVTSARGRTSRLQWMVNEIALLAEDTASRDEMLSRVQEAYSALFAGGDALLGRNAARAARLAEILAPLHEDARVRSLVRTYGPKCASQQGTSRATCDRHFATLATGAL